MDPIDRQDAIDAVLDRMDTEKHGRNAKPEEIKWTLERVPSAQPEQLERCPIYDGVCGYPSDQCYECPRHHGAQPEQQWIPCSERLPHYSETVIVSILDDTGDYNLNYTDVGWITHDGTWIVDNDENNMVTAWMPLPESYNGE